MIRIRTQPFGLNGDCAFKDVFNKKNTNLDYSFPKWKDTNTIPLEQKNVNGHNEKIKMNFTSIRTQQRRKKKWFKSGLIQLWPTAVMSEQVTLGTF